MRGWVWLGFNSRSYILEYIIDWSILYCYCWSCLLRVSIYIYIIIIFVIFWRIAILLRYKFLWIWMYRLLVVSTKVGGVPEVLPDHMIIFSEPEQQGFFLLLLYYSIINSMIRFNTKSSICYFQNQNRSNRFIRIP